MGADPRMCAILPAIQAVSLFLREIRPAALANLLSDNRRWGNHKSGRDGPARTLGGEPQSPGPHRIGSQAHLRLRTIHLRAPAAETLLASPVGDQVRRDLRGRGRAETAEYSFAVPAAQV